VSIDRLEENAFVVVKALRPGVEVARGLLSFEGIDSNFTFTKCMIKKNHGTGNIIGTVKQV
jgi:hypothetical protein